MAQVIKSIEHQPRQEPSLFTDQFPGLRVSAPHQSPAIKIGPEKQFRVSSPSSRPIRLRGATPFQNLRLDLLCHNHAVMGTVAAQPEYLSALHCDEAGLIEIVERALHPSASEWLFLRELRVGTRRQNGRGQRIDAFALNTLPHTAMKRVCYEVKTSRADFLSEIKRPLKRRIGMRYSNEFYFAHPPPWSA
jgi:hypothetical protein